MEIKKIVSIILLFACSNILVIAQNSSIKNVEETLSFTRADATYEGTFSKPNGEGPFPVVVMISGMGMQDRDWSFMGGKYKMAKTISDHLNQNGIAVYRYDDRGHGKSTGSAESNTSFIDLSEDVYKAVESLRARADVGKIGLLGHSLGGILSIMTASNHKDIDFIISLSGSFQSGAEIKFEQARSLKRWKTNHDMSDEEVVKNGEKFVKASISYSKGGEGIETMKEILKNLVTFQIMNLPPDVMAENLKVYKDTTEFIQRSFEGALEYYTSPHQKSFNTYLPAEDLKNITCPVLILFGEKDNHVNVSTNMPNVGRAITDSTIADITIRIISEADHGYSGPGYIEKGEMVPGVLDFITNWVNFRK